jgi:hypothetical protein
MPQIQATRTLTQRKRRAEFGCKEIAERWREEHASLNRRE